jgi:hypothetical protein
MEMEFIGKETLKSLSDRYDNNDILGAVSKILAGGIEKNTSSEDECILKYIQILEGTRTRLKELHWNTKSSTIHELMDSLSSFVISNEDDIAEAFMGVCGYRIKVGQIVPIIPDVCDHIEIIEYLSSETLFLIKKLLNNVKYVGITKLLEDIYCGLNKYAYLATQE